MNTVKTILLIDGNGVNISPATDITSIYYEFIDSSIVKRKYVFDLWPAKVDLRNDETSYVVTQSLTSKILEIEDNQTIANGDGSDIFVSYVYQEILLGTNIYKLNSSVYNLSNILYNYTSKHKLSKDLAELNDSIGLAWDASVDEMNTTIHNEATKIDELSTHVDNTIMKQYVELHDELNDSEKQFKIFTLTYKDQCEKTDQFAKETDIKNATILDALNYIQHMFKEQLTSIDFAQKINKAQLIPGEVYRVNMAPITLNCNADPTSIIGTYINRAIWFNDSYKDEYEFVVHLEADSATTFKKTAKYAIYGSEHYIVDVDIEYTGLHNLLLDYSSIEMLTPICEAKDLCKKEGLCYDYSFLNPIYQDFGDQNVFVVTRMKDKYDNEMNFDFLTLRNCCQNKDTPEFIIEPTIFNYESYYHQLSIRSNSLLLDKYAFLLYSTLYINNTFAYNEISLEASRYKSDKVKGCLDKFIANTLSLMLNGENINNKISNSLLYARRPITISDCTILDSDIISSYILQLCSSYINRSFVFFDANIDASHIFALLNLYIYIPYSKDATANMNNCYIANTTNISFPYLKEVDSYDDISIIGDTPIYVCANALFINGNVSAPSYNIIPQ